VLGGGSKTQAGRREGFILGFGGSIERVPGLEHLRVRHRGVVQHVEGLRGPARGGGLGVELALDERGGVLGVLAGLPRDGGDGVLGRALGSGGRTQRAADVVSCLAGDVPLRPQSRDHPRDFVLALLPSCLSGGLDGLRVLASLVGQGCGDTREVVGRLPCSGLGRGGERVEVRPAQRYGFLAVVTVARRPVHARLPEIAGAHSLTS
jgi:hypothetical protein